MCLWHQNLAMSILAYSPGTFVPGWDRALNTGQRLGAHKGLEKKATEPLRETGMSAEGLV